MHAEPAPVALPPLHCRYVEFSLQYIFGIGHTTAKAILVSTGVENKRTKVGSCGMLRMSGPGLRSAGGACVGGLPSLVVEEALKARRTAAMMQQRRHTCAGTAKRWRLRQQAGSCSCGSRAP